LLLQSAVLMRLMGCLPHLSTPLAPPLVTATKTLVNPTGKRYEIPSSC